MASLRLEAFLRRHFVHRSPRAGRWVIAESIGTSDGAPRDWTAAERAGLVAISEHGGGLHLYHASLTADGRRLLEEIVASLPA